ncbi:hypothetical protein KUCAC02_034647, partial [Chaenocephalus aceratus]
SAAGPGGVRHEARREMGVQEEQQTAVIPCFSPQSEHRAAAPLLEPCARFGEARAYWHGGARG